tara:strand:- start:976 stop:1728 length:753 start_codon:yes stop_codon:yes gene_type:complete
MSNDLFIPITFTTKLNIKPSEIRTDYNDIFIKKLKTNFEGICTKYGYIKKDSIKIIKRSIGSIISDHFNGNMLFELNCIAEICNPVIGSIAKCKVKNKNTMGLLAQGFYNENPVLEVIIPKISAGIKSEIDIDTVNIGDDILIEVCGKKFVLYDKYISIIGKVIKSKEKIIQHDRTIEDDDEDDEEVDDEKFEDIDPVTLEENEDEDDDDEKKSDDDDEDEEDDEEEEDEEFDEDLDIDDNIEDILFEED